MKLRIQNAWRPRLAVAGTLTAAALMLSLVPLNMGGCSAGSLGEAVGGAVGGSTGQLIRAGGTAVQAQALGEDLDPNLALNKYVTLVGLTVASGSPRADSTFVFGVLNTDEVNAYAGPNGYIMITRGAINRMQDESELAGVLAHEIAHVANKDGLNMMKAQLNKQAAAQAMNSNAKIAQFNIGTDAFLTAVVDGHYSQDQESRADLAGVDYLVASGYDPEGDHRFLQRMSAAQKSGGGVMSSHPDMAGRAVRVGEKIKQKGNPGGATLADRFKRSIAKPAA